MIRGINRFKKTEGTTKQLTQHENTEEKWLLVPGGVTVHCSCLYSLETVSRTASSFPAEHWRTAEKSLSIRSTQ